MSWGSGLPLLADTSAWARIGRYEARWLQALEAERIVSCGVVHLELLFSARAREDVLELDADLGTLRELPVSRATMSSARQAVLDLASQGSAGHHRVPPQDAIIAACAAEHGCAVLHYDAHYDRLADVLAFESVWVAPRGSL